MWLGGELRNGKRSLDDALNRLKGGKEQSKFTLKMAEKKMSAQKGIRLKGIKKRRRKEQR
ncbi:hypothetical protein C5S53_12020 [Methanophagales archaeon]|nr:hypothetical protein C5S53_12020 [Methanophagales archaeon]